VIFTVHAFASREHQPAWRRRLFLAIERAMDHVTDHYCVTTASGRGQLVARRIAPIDKVSVVPLGIEMPPAPTPEVRRRARAALGLDARDLTIAASGRLEPQKGLGYLLEAFALVHRRLPNARLLVFGDGPLRPRLEARAATLGLGPAVRFLGWRTDVPALLPGADVFCLSSLWESFSYALLDAMAAGLPIVATRLDVIPEVVEEHRQALLVPPGNADALAAALITMLSDPERRWVFSASSRRRVEQCFNLSRMVQSHEDLYLRLLAAEAPARAAA
jgi:glycosyltransferase involved in cell wall biosynthesis